MKHNLYLLLVVGSLVSLALSTRPGFAKGDEGSATGGSVTEGTVTPGTVTAVAEGRQISAAAVGKVAINVTGANARVHLDNHVLDVEKERLVLDGAEQAALPAASAKIEINVKDELLTVKADGKEVLRAKLDNKK